MIHRFLESNVRRANRAKLLLPPHIAAIPLWRMRRGVPDAVEEIPSTSESLPGMKTHISQFSQTSSRRSAALWFVAYLLTTIFWYDVTPRRLCSLHNEVNMRLKKAEFDCAHLDDEYDCGCGDTPVKGSLPSKADSDPMDLEYNPSKDDVTGAGLIKGG